jgi:hypothetical protein
MGIAELYRPDGWSRSGTNDHPLRSMQYSSPPINYRHFGPDSVSAAAAPLAGSGRRPRKLEQSYSFYRGLHASARFLSDRGQLCQPYGGGVGPVIQMWNTLRFPVDTKRLAGKAMSQRIADPLDKLKPVLWTRTSGR